MKIKPHVLVLALCVLGCMSACAWFKAPVSDSTPTTTENPNGGYDVKTPAGTLHVDTKPVAGTPIEGKLPNGTKYTFTPPAEEPPKTNWDALVGIVGKVAGTLTGHPELIFAIGAAGKVIGEATGISGAPVTAKKPEDELPLPTSPAGA